MKRREFVKIAGVVAAGATMGAQAPIIGKFLTPNPAWPPEKGAVAIGPVKIGKIEDIIKAAKTGGIKFMFNFGKSTLPGAVFYSEETISHQKKGATQESGKDISGGAANGTPDGFVAYCLKCPHLGCIVKPGMVAFGGEKDVIECPCHYTYYDISQAGRVLAGPAPSPVPEIKLDIREGELWAVDWWDVDYVKSLTVYKGLV